MNTMFFKEPHLPIEYSYQLFLRNREIEKSSVPCPCYPRFMRQVIDDVSKGTNPSAYSTR